MTRLPAPFAVVCLLAVVVSGSSEVLAQSDTGPAAEKPAAAPAVDFQRDVRPILAARCFRCHSESLKQEGGLKLDQADGIRKGGDGGPVIVPGKSGESRLIQAVVGSDDLRMPPEGAPLTAAQIDVLRRWVDGGAPLPTGDAPVAHWSFAPIQRASLPLVDASQRSSVIRPLDAFLAGQRATRGIAPTADASKPVLLRRVHFDLIGLPPTETELADFLSDDGPDALERVVDRLLASPAHGERWGRHWMDVWRYSDWDGYGNEVRESQPFVWRWRDWIVESLNADKAYNQMVVEMLAGDELAPDDPATLRATGFLVRNWFKFNRNVWLDNTVEHTGKAFLGLTLNCARCHDHMYDPIKQSEYYSLRAIFEPYDIRTDRVPGQPDVAKDGLVRAFDKQPDATTFVFVRGDEKQPLKDSPVGPGIPKVLAGDVPLAPHAVALSTPAYYPGFQAFVQTESLEAARAALRTSETGLVAAQTALAQARSKWEAAKQAEAERAKTASASAPAPASAAPSSPASPVAPMPNTTPAAPVAAKPRVLFSDDFAAAKPQLWKAGAGSFVYRDGHVSQTESLDQMCGLTSAQTHPRDFVARFRFRITGGDVYRSLGLSFDTPDDRQSTFIYVSAHGAGPKMQLAYRRDGADQYPLEAMKSLPIALNREYEMTVAVKGDLLNVSLDGQLQLVQRLASRLPDGHIVLWTYDATGEFRGFELAELPGDAKLTEAAAGASAAASGAAASGAMPERSPLAVAEGALRLAELAASVAESRVTAARASLASVEARIAADRALYGNPPSANAKEVALDASRAEREATARTAESNVLDAEHKLETARQAALPGDAKSQKAVTDAATNLANLTKARDAAVAAVGQANESYTRFGPLYPASSSGRRLALARWIASDDNRLAARVAVNHLWMRHFSTPLVSSVFDFGLNGKAPTHPELLDWLARDLIDGGWSMKQLHRELVTSGAYRLATSPRAEDARAQQLDPENATYWRANVRRMEAEVVRDSTLAVSGQLNRRLGGPDLDPASGHSVPRRSLYFRSSKEKKMTFLALFDSANVVECYRRSESIAPQQALALINSGLSLAESRRLARVLADETRADDSLSTGDPRSTGDARMIERAFLRILGRLPTVAEQTECLAFLDAQASQFAAGKLNAFAGDADSSVKPAADPRQRARENLIHVLFNHNDFVTIR